MEQPNPKEGSTSFLEMFFSISWRRTFVSILFWADVFLHFSWEDGDVVPLFGGFFGKLWKGRCLENHPIYKVVSNPPVIGQNKAIWKGTNRVLRGRKQNMDRNHLLSGMILQVTPWRLRCPKRDQFKRIFIFQPWICRGFVGLPVCNTNTLQWTRMGGNGNPTFSNRTCTSSNGGVHCFVYRRAHERRIGLD